MLQAECNIQVILMKTIHLKVSQSLLMVHKPLISALLKYFVDYQLNSNVYVIDLYIYKRVKTDKCTIAISHILNCLAGY